MLLKDIDFEGDPNDRRVLFEVTGLNFYQDEFKKQGERPQVVMLNNSFDSDLSE